MSLKVTHHYNSSLRMNCFEKNILLEEFHLQKKKIYIVKITVSLTRLKTTKPKLLQSCYDLNP